MLITGPTGAEMLLPLAARSKIGHTLRPTDPEANIIMLATGLYLHAIQMGGQALALHPCAPTCGSSSMTKLARAEQLVDSR